MFGYFPGGYRPLPTLREDPAEHILRVEAERERDQQRRSRNAARRALHVVAGRRAPEARAALSVRALALKRAA